MTLYSKITNELTSSGKRFIVDTLADMLGCEETIDGINTAIAEQGGYDFKLDLDRDSLSLSVMTPMDTYDCFIEVIDLNEDDDSAALLRRRFVDAINDLETYAIRDISVAYEAVTDDDEYGYFDDDEFYDAFHDGAW